MNSLIPGSVYSSKEIPNANKLYMKMKIFPTPFKGIYYVPYESERSGWYITDPQTVLFKAAALYLKTNQYYFGLRSALYYLRITWNATGTDIINQKLSRKINKKLPLKKYWRGKIINKIMNSYSFPIRFHRINHFSLNGTTKKGNILFSNLEKTKKDAVYLCKKGDKDACNVLEILRRNRA